MKPGPRPLPTEVARNRPGVRKNPGRLATRNDLPTDLEELPADPPAHVSGPEADAWRYVRSHLPAGVAFRSDALALEMLSRLWAAFQTGTLDNAGSRQLDTLLGKFGLNPSDRARVPQMKKPKPNPFSKFSD